MIDFEKPLQNTIKKNFPGVIIDICFFTIQNYFGINLKVYDYTNLIN